MPLLLTARGDQGMESINTGGGGGGGGQQPARLILPPGFLFQPSDELLLTLYLRNAVAGLPLPRRTPIPLHELYIAGADPWIVQREVAFPYGEGKEFFCFTHRIRRGSGALRTAGTGTWVAKGRDVPITAKRTGELVGHRLALNFVPKCGCGGGEERANWIMHEYRLPEQQGGDLPSSSSLKRKRKGNGNEKPFQELVLCKIYRRSRSRGTPPSPEEAASATTATTFSG